MWQASENGPAIGPQVIFHFDSSGLCTLSVGPGLEDLGLGPGELVGRNLFDVYKHDPSAQASLRRAVSGESFTVERQFDGRRLWVFYQPMHDSAGTVTGVLGVATDVTEQRRIEGEVRASRERASLLANLSETLTREVMDLEALLRVAVCSVTKAVAQVGVVWLCSPEERRLEPMVVCHREDAGAEPTEDWRAETVHLQVQMDMAAVDTAAAPRILDLGAAAEVDHVAGELLAHLADRFDLQTGLRVPLRSRGVLVGMIDVARGALMGGFTDGDIALVTDIAERCALALDNALLLNAHREAREDLVKFEALADASGDLIGIVDTDGRAVYVNPRVYEADLDLAEENVWITVAEQTGEERTAAIRAALEAQGRWSGDVRLSASSGLVVVRVEVFRLHHPDTGADLGTAWIGQDVTELRAAEEALRAANSDLKQFKALVEASPDFVAIASLDGEVKYVNPGGRELIGLDPDVDVTSTSIPDYLTPEGLEASVGIERPAVISNGHWEGESTLRNFRGPPIPVAIASFLIREVETGEPFALATVQRDLSERLRAETALRELADQRQALLSRLVDAQDDERTRIAADVHDDPVQALAVVDLRLGLLRRQLRERAPDLLETLEPLQASVAGATERLRALLFDLEPPDLQRGLTGALCRAAEEIFENSPIRCTVDGAQEPDVPDTTRAIAYRIAKEAMFNARKHAEPENVEVTVTGREGGLEVCIVDDGVGLGPGPTESTPGHRGLFNMQDRAAVAGGRCTIRNRQVGGTSVVAWLPGRSTV